MLFTGSMTAIVTPFSDGRVDENALRKLIDWQISCGTDAIVPCGSTGEAMTLTQNEREKVVRICVEGTSGRVPVLAGAGSNCTADAIELARLVKKCGADGMLQVTPYYNKPTQEGLYQHFLAIAGIVDLPIVLYNVPGRTAVNMLAETTLRLAEIDTIVGIKESSGDLNQIKKIIAGAPASFAVISGDDALNLDVFMAGGKGSISVTANIVPDRVAAVWDAFASGKFEDARKLHEGLLELNHAMFLETNPVPVKTALSMMRKCKEEFRLPLTPMTEENKEKLIGVLKKNGII